MEINEMMNGLIQTIVMGLFSLAIAGVTYCFTALANKIKVQTAKIEDRELRLVAENSLKQLDSLVFKTVEAIDVSVGAEIRQAIADGKVDKSELINLKNVAKEDILIGLKPEFVGACENVVGDVDKYIENEIERALGVIKGKIIAK